MFELIFTIAIIGALVFVFFLDGDKNKLKVTLKHKKAEDVSKSTTRNFKNTQDRLPFSNIKSIGEVEDKSLIVKDKNTYVGVIEVKGINYNLSSIDEKLLLEDVFQRTLNGLDYPIQIFIQSRRVDVDSYNNLYRKRIEELIENVRREEQRYRLMVEKNEDVVEIEEVAKGIKRLEKQIDYGNRVMNFINSIAGNSDILDKKYFIVTPYHYDSSQFNQQQTEDEKFLTAFNAINNRLESISRSLGSVSLESHMLNGIELAELLYISFNKQDSDSYKIKNALKSGYANHIVSSRPVEFKMLENEEKKLENLINTESAI